MNKEVYEAPMVQFLKVEIEQSIAAGSITGSLDSTEINSWDNQNAGTQNLDL